MKNVLLVRGLGIHTVPKVASTSLSAAVAGMDYRRVSPEDPEPRFRFMVVRHPLERLVSAWRFFTPSHRMQHMRVFRHSVEPDMAFEPFVRVVLRDVEKDRHTTPQAVWKGPHAIDRLVKLENLPSAWGEMQARFGLGAIPHRNPTEHDEWWTYYTPDLARDALEVYGPDLEIFENAT